MKTITALLVFAPCVALASLPKLVIVISDNCPLETRNLVLRKYKSATNDETLLDYDALNRCYKTSNPTKTAKWWSAKREALSKWHDWSAAECNAWLDSKGIAPNEVRAFEGTGPAVSILSANAITAGVP